MASLRFSKERNIRVSVGWYSGKKTRSQESAIGRGRAGRQDSHATLAKWDNGFCFVLIRVSSWIEPSTSPLRKSANFSFAMPVRSRAPEECHISGAEESSQPQHSWRTSGALYIRTR